MRASFPETIIFKAPPGLNAAVHQAASRDHTTLSEFLRRAAIRSVRELGIPIGVDEAGESTALQSAERV